MFYEIALLIIVFSCAITVLAFLRRVGVIAIVFEYFVSRDYSAVITVFGDCVYVLGQGLLTTYLVGALGISFVTFNVSGLVLAFVLVALGSYLRR